MHELGICSLSKNAWPSPLHLVSKKGGEIRPCGDYRQLHAVKKPNRYPIPRIQDFTYRGIEIGNLRVLPCKPPCCGLDSWIHVTSCCAEIGFLVLENCKIHSGEVSLLVKVVSYAKIYFADQTDRIRLSRFNQAKNLYFTGTDTICISNRVWVITKIIRFVSKHFM